MLSLKKNLYEFSDGTKLSFNISDDSINLFDGKDIIPIDQKHLDTKIPHKNMTLYCHMDRFGEFYLPLHFDEDVTVREFTESINKFYNQYVNQELYEDLIIQSRNMSPNSLAKEYYSAVISRFENCENPKILELVGDAIFYEGVSKGKKGYFLEYGS